MNEGHNEGGNSPFKYTIEIRNITDMIGFVVEIQDKFNSKNYTLSGIYSERSTAIKDADVFVNNLYQKEILTLIN